MVKSAVYGINGNKIAYENSVRVCAYNVGNWSRGQSGTPAGTDELYNEFIQAFMKCNANVYMFSEWDSVWSTGVPSNSVWGFLKPYKSTYDAASSAWASQKTYSDFPIKAEYYKHFTNNSNYLFLDNTINVADKDIHFICTHLTWESAEAKNAEISEILNYISSNNIEYYIIAGDMNLGSDGDGHHTDATVARAAVTLFENAGGISLQGGGWGCRDNDGFFNTGGTDGWYSEPESMHMADNIVVSSNMRFLNMFEVISPASDHNPICADILIN